MQDLKLWTIQHKAAYDRFLETGVFRADPQFSLPKDADEFAAAYQWMAKEMEARIGPPPLGVEYPVWAWYRWQGKNKRLDMRSHRYYGNEPNIPIVLLSLEVPRDQVLLSDFDMYHCVLNQIYCPLCEAEELPEPTPDQIKKSWENIFLIDEVTDYWGAPKYTQATMWELRPQWIKKAEFFKSI